MGFFSKGGNVGRGGRYTGKHEAGFQHARGVQSKTGGKIKATGRHRAPKSGGRGGYVSGKGGAADGLDRWG